MALIPVMSKILENIISKQLLKFINENNLFNPSHHAYRAHHNTKTAMIHMIDTWTEALDSGQMAGVCLLDMSAAFDVVNHSILLKKLEFYGFNKETILWIRSYLTNRRQTVTINGVLSKFLPVTSGVPQGSILGPLLYTLFTNELPEVVYQDGDKKQRPESICCYADDTTLTCLSSDHSKLSENLTKQYSRIKDFMIDNRLKLNDDKTHLIVLSTKKARLRSQSANLARIIS